MKRLLCAALSALLLLTCQTAFAGRLEVDLSVDGTPVSDMLYGAFYEDINFAADGGLYAELLRNRSFENRSLTSPKSSDSFTGWMFNHLNRAEGTVTRMTEGGLNDNNTTYMRVSVESGAYRVVNFGYSTVIGRAGIPLDEGAEYGFYCFLRSADFSGRISAALTTVGGSPLSDAIELTPSGEWQKLSGVFTAKETTDAVLSLTLEGRGSVDIDMVSLLPKSAFGASWLSGGLRADLVEALRALSPRFIRFPGGCVAEGSYFKANAYNWKDTIGAPETRRENENTWGYMQSYGLGFDEYFRLCEELNAEPLPVVHASTLCQARGSQDAPYTETEKESHIQDVLDLIEYANGDETTAYGALRAKNGHPAPYNMKFIAIGNENWGDEYFYRYGEIRAAVKAKYPEIECVVAAGPVASGALIEHSLAVIRSRYPNDIADEHYYMDSGWFLRNTSRYDAYSRNGNSIFLGEFAAHEPAVGGRRPNNMYSAVCEAAYLTGIERNADLVKMCCYAPLFARNGFTQWTPNLIWFDARSVVKTPNYYAFMMFSNAVGDRYIPANADLPDTVYSSVTASDEKVYIKLVNAGNAGEDITVSLPLTDRRALVQTLSGKAGDQNSFDVPDRLKPAETYVELVGGKITVTLPAMGILVLTCEK